MTRQTTTPRRRWLLPVTVLVVLAAGGGYLAWSTFFAGDPPTGASIDDAAAVLSPSVSASPAASSSATLRPSATAADAIEGTWTIDTDIGWFADYTSAWAGFRVNEVLGQGIGATTAIGRTPSVTGELIIEGETLTAASIEADLTTIASDRPRRDDAIQRALETAQFPTATFVLTQPVELDGVPADGATGTANAIGDLTIHGETRSVVFPLEARLIGDTIVVVGSTGVTFSDFGVSMPSAPIVVSVEDIGLLELQLFFERA